MIGTFEGFKVTFGSFGHQYTTIDGQRYITYFDLANPNLRGLAADVRVEFEIRPGPTGIVRLTAGYEGAGLGYVGQGG